MDEGRFEGITVGFWFRMRKEGLRGYGSHGFAGVARGRGDLLLVLLSSVSTQTSGELHDR